MAFAIVLKFEGVGEDAYWAVNEQLGIGRDGTGVVPNGLVVHGGGPTDGGWLVTELWESPAAHQAFMDGPLGAALGAAGLPAPAVVLTSELVNVLRPG